jgi:hypothetical protein
MQRDIRSFVATVAELELAGLMSCAEGARRLAEITMRYAARSSEAFSSGIGARAASSERPREQAGVELMAAHGDYVRELAGLSSWLLMNFINHLDLARSGRKAFATDHSGSTADDHIRQ